MTGSLKITRIMVTSSLVASLGWAALPVTAQAQTATSGDQIKELQNEIRQMQREYQQQLQNIQKQHQSQMRSLQKQLDQLKAVQAAPPPSAPAAPPPSAPAAPTGLAIPPPGAPLPPPTPGPEAPPA